MTGRVTARLEMRTSCPVSPWSSHKSARERNNSTKLASDLYKYAIAHAPSPPNNNNEIIKKCTMLYLSKTHRDVLDESRSY